MPEVESWKAQLDGDCSNSTCLGSGSLLDVSIQLLYKSFSLVFPYNLVYVVVIGVYLLLLNLFISLGVVCYFNLYSILSIILLLLLSFYLDSFEALFLDLNSYSF